MGGAVSSGESNDDLVDNLMAGDYVKTPLVETVFRAVDRAFYFTKPFKHNAYKDLAWKDGNLHISAPCIYSEVMENLDLKPGMSFLNIGAGTGYLSTMIGLVLGRHGTNHGIELHSNVVDYASAKLKAFIRSSPAIDLFDFCEPHFAVGNCMDLMPTEQRYDRIYCGAACLSEDVQLITDLLKVDGICIIPLNDSLVQIRRVAEGKTVTKTLLPVTFATLVPSFGGNDPAKKSTCLPRWNPPMLSELCRSEIRDILRRTIKTPDTRVPEVTMTEESRKRRRKRKAERRRANRLLVVQRRRNGEAREARNNNGFVAISYSMRDEAQNTSSEWETEEESAPPRRVPLFRGRASSLNTLPTSTVGSGEKRSNTNRSRLTQQGRSGRPEKVEEDSAQASSSAKMARKDNSAPSTEEPGQADNDVSDLASRVIGNISAARAIEEAPRRRARTESILARIREIIQNRQLEREAQRVLQAHRDLDLQREVDEALREPPEGQEDAEMPDIPQNGDEVDHECEWTTDDSSSSSSTSTSSSSDTDCLAHGNNADVSLENPFANVGNDEPVPRRRNNGPVPVRCVNGSEMCVNINPEMALPHPLPRRHRLVLDSSSDDDEVLESSDDDDSMDGFPREQSPRVTNAQKEIEAIEREESQPAPVVHPFSVGLMQKIDSLALPLPIKKYLNYQRNFS